MIKERTPLAPQRNSKTGWRPDKEYRGIHGPWSCIADRWRPGPRLVDFEPSPKHYENSKRDQGGLVPREGHGCRMRVSEVRSEPAARVPANRGCYHWRWVAGFTRAARRRGSQEDIPRSLSLTLTGVVRRCSRGVDWQSPCRSRPRFWSFAPGSAPGLRLML